MSRCWILPGATVFTLDVRLLGHNQMAAVKKSISLLSLLFELFDASTMAFAWSTSSFLDSLWLNRSPKFANSIQHVVIDFRHHMKQAKLMLRFGPDFGDRLGVQRRTVGDNRFGRKPMVFQVLKEPYPMCASFDETRTQAIGLSAIGSLASRTTRCPR